MLRQAPTQAAARRRALVLCNPHARQATEASAEAEAQLRELGIEPLETDLDHPERISALIRERGPAADVIVLGGGDGTLHQAAPALLEVRRPLGVLPLGTANDLARTLGIPLELDAACRVIAEGEPHAIDVGLVNDHPFFNAANIGVGVEVTRRLTGELKRRWGVLSYGRAVADAVQGSRAFRAEIRSDQGSLRVRSVQITVGNGRFYGGGMTVSREATIDEGLLDLYSLEPMSFGRLLMLGPSLRRGSHGRWEAVQVLRAPHLEVSTDRPMRVTADGELVTRTPARFAIAPRALEVLIPRGAPGEGLGRGGGGGCCEATSK